MKKLALLSLLLGLGLFVAGCGSETKPPPAKLPGGANPPANVTDESDKPKEGADDMPKEGGEPAGDAEGKPDGEAAPDKAAGDETTEEKAGDEESK